MGTCMSSKSKGALANTRPNAPSKLKKHFLTNKMDKKNKVYKGTATSFGFKRPVVSASKNSNNTAAAAADPLPETLTSSVESLSLAPNNAQSGISRLARPTTLATNNKGHCFGLRPSTQLSNKVADSQNVAFTNLTSTKCNLKFNSNLGLLNKTKVAPSFLPRPNQYPVRLAAPVGFHTRTTSAEKNAKTAANNNTARRSRSANGGSSASSVNDTDSGVGSHKSGGDLDMIEQLECSPSARSRFRSKQKSRPMEMVFSNKNEKKFELRDLTDSIEVTEIMPLELPPLPFSKKFIPAKFNSRQQSRDSSEEDEGIEDEPGEEKVHRDHVINEKDEMGVIGAGEETVDMDEVWGHGEAMIGDDDLTSGQDADVDLDCKAMVPPLRSVLLSIEDHAFATLAAMSSSTMIEDEICPEGPDFQNSLSLTSTSTVTTPNESQPQQGEKNHSEGSPASPDSPTHTSNSLSLSSDIRDRDFIDDEICDQPGLVYDNITANSSGNTLVPDEPSPKQVKPVNCTVANLSIDCGSARNSSVGTLSPCESIASDDLIMDFELSAIDDDHRLDASSIDIVLTDGEGDEEGEVAALQELTSLIAARPELLNGVRATRQLRPRVGSSGGSGADSPRSLDTPRLRSGSALSSPLRSARQGTSSPGEDFSQDSGIKVHRGAHQSMYQDCINIKALLLRLSRMLQESESAQSQDTSQKNGLTSCESDDDEQAMVADLQRQVVFLQSQVEDKERTIRLLQTHQPVPESRVGGEKCNAATQTDRVRPLSTGPVLSAQPDAAGGSLVSISSDVARPHNPRPVSRLPQWRRAPSPSELHKPLPLISRRQT